MTDSKQQSPPSLLTSSALSKSFYLGIGILVLFVVGAGLAFLFASLLGWEGTSAILLALVTGPLLGGVIFGLGWIIFKPSLVEQSALAERNANGNEELSAEMDAASNSDIDVKG